MKKIKVMTVFGTRPEAIKMFPLVKELEDDARFESVVVTTGQHRQMLDQILETFDVHPDYDLTIMKKGQSLVDINVRVLEKLTPLIQQNSPDILLVHGDTTTTFAAALAAFYEKVPVGHVEAGLRTYEKYSPFPEEMNRQLTDRIAELYFAPTLLSKENLVREGIEEEKIFVTGNTAIDAMNYTLAEHKTVRDEIHKEGNQKIILVTMHRRENIGQPMVHVFRTINKLVEENPDIKVVFPMHKNPIVRDLVKNNLNPSKQIELIEPLDVSDFHKLISESYMIMTDSGGVQEEAPALSVPVLVLRETTERPEGVSAGTLKVVGTDESRLYEEATELLRNRESYEKMAKASNPYGDGTASKKILEAIAANVHLFE